MGLEDKFYPEDGTYLTKFDNAMIRAMGTAGETYQNVTGLPYTGLVETMYKTAAVVCGVSVLPFNPAALLMLPVLAGAAISPPIHSPLEEEIRCEATGQPRYTGKFFRASCLFVNACAAVGYLSHQKSPPEEPTFIDQAIIVSGTLFVQSLLTYALADYMAKSNIPKPPKESLPRRVLNSLQALVPVPTPATNQ